MNSLQDPALQVRLRAVAGWMELGLPADGLVELEGLPDPIKEHPELLKLRFNILRPLRRFAEALDTAERLTTAAPGDKWGWLYRSHALHWLGRSNEAYSRLQPLRGKFPTSFELPYDLACYCAQTGRIDEARVLIKESISLSGRKELDVLAMAGKDPDLQPLWPELRSDTTSPE